MDFLNNTNYFHIDSYPLRHWEIDKCGYLRYVAPIARTGKLSYSDKLGNRWDEDVPPETLTSSLDSFKMKVITSPHPPYKLDSTNTLPHIKGSSGHAGFFDGSFLWLTGTIFDQKTIKKIVNKECSELSPGYDALIKLDSDRIIQAGRDGNHISVVPKGRNGRKVGFRLDSDQPDGDFSIFTLDDELEIGDLTDIPESLLEGFQLDRQYFVLGTKRTDVTGDSKAESGNNLESPLGSIADNQDQLLGANKMAVQIILDDEIYTIDGTDAERLKTVIASTKKAQTDLQSRLDSATVELEQVKTQKDTLEGELGTIKGEKEALQTRIDEASQNTPEAVDLSKEISSRLSLWSEVLPAIQKYDPAFKLDAESEVWELSPTQIKQLYLVKRDQAVNNKDRAETIAKLDLSSDANQNYINGLFEGLRTDAINSTVKEPSHSDVVLNMLLNGKSQQPVDRQDSADDPRQKLIATIDGNSKRK